MENGEVGLASVVLHRDYRDYYGRHGGEGFVRLQGGKDADLTVSLSDEQCGDLRQRDPWTLFRDGEAWRPNPFMDVGDMHLLTTRLRLDTREREGSPWSGWYVTGEIEQGSGNLTRIGAPINTDPLTGTPLPTAPEHVNYTRGLFDLRRYNRISQDMSLNMRLVAGGWLAGDQLPTERRFSSLGGPGTLPGYGFRETGMSPDVLQCSDGVVQAGTPGQCDRDRAGAGGAAVASFAGSLRDDASGRLVAARIQRTHAVGAVRRPRSRKLAGGAAGRGIVVVRRGCFPPFATFKSDAGVGIDFMADSACTWPRR